MEYDPQTLERIQQGRSKFAAMAATYGLGVFNDSFFRQSAMLLAVAAGRHQMQGWIMSLFALPYLLFASPAGWFADRFPKRRIVIVAKALELVAMLCGAIGICTLNWGFIFAMVFTMGLQSCLFGPALNGSIPELYPAVYVTKANATLKVVVTIMILGGIAAAGVALDRGGVGWFDVPLGRAVVGFGAVAIAAAGLVLSFGVPRRPAADAMAPFPWAGPWDTALQFFRLRNDSLLGKIVAANVFIWFAGSLIVPLVNSMKGQFGWGESVPSYLLAVEMMGVAVGGIVVSRLADGARWYRFLAPALLIMAVILALMEVIPNLPEAAQLPSCYVLLALAGFCGGVVMVPCEAFIQVRPEPGRRGTVIASVNFGVFAGILISGPVAFFSLGWIVPTRGLALLGCLAAIAGVWLHVALKHEESG